MGKMAENETPGPCVNLVVFKVVQRCNLDCTYCYVYNRGDDSWRTRATYVSEKVARKLGQRIAEHCEKYALRGFTVELHGGEPLLLGKSRMQRTLDVLKSESAGVNLHFAMQTNGLLLDEEWLDLISSYGISFGISLDGPPEIADRYRVKRGGGGSTQELLDTITRLRRTRGPVFDELFGGCLAVIDPSCNGAELVDWFVENGFPTFDFLLPDGNQANPPQGWTGSSAPYRRFLIEAFDRWYTLGERAPRIRTFEQMMMGRMGRKVRLDALGGDLRYLCVVESDGSIGVNDVARICGGEYAKDTLTVFEHPLDRHVVQYRIEEVQRPAGECLSCPQFSSCGGGHLPHRFDGKSFDNPSLYCDALFGLSARIHQVLLRDLPPVVWRKRASVPASSCAKETVNAVTS